VSKAKHRQDVSGKYIGFDFLNHKGCICAQFVPIDLKKVLLGSVVSKTRAVIQWSKMGFIYQIVFRALESCSPSVIFAS